MTQGIGRTPEIERQRREKISKSHLGIFRPWQKGVERPEVSGANSGRWKGGKIMRNGYWEVLCKDHPARSGRGYVAEHRLVMEKILGRYLKPRENVHHKNGVRTDNRPENLELWVRPQNPGQRLDDLLSWVTENYRDELIRMLAIGPSVAKNQGDGG